MTRRRAASAIAASPVLVGAVTLLVAIVAVFLAYNANAGLPFVPTYNLRAELPSGAKLVAGNEVRIGGFRAGVVDKIRATRVGQGDSERSVGIVDLKLDKTVEPLPRDSSLIVRPRSALGLKYIELVPGRSRRTFAAGDTIPVGNGGATAQQPLDLEDVLSTFDAQTREASRTALDGFGSALAGRGASINEAIRGLSPLLRYLQPVMANLNNPDTELEGFFRGLGRAAGEAAPVARIQAELFANMATTFAAISRSPAALQDTIAEGPATQVQAIHSFRFQQPFLADFADLSRRLLPGARELPRALPPLNRALLAGTRVLPKTVRLSNDLGSLFAALEHLGNNPNSLLAIKDLDQALKVTRPGLQFVAPYQTVCNYAVYFLNPLGEHISQTTGGGTVEQILLKQANPTQANKLTARTAARPADTPVLRPTGSNQPAALHKSDYGPAITNTGAADCQGGQNGYPGRFSPDNRYGPNELGGRNVALGQDQPGSRGGTFTSRRLGITGLGSVP
jgi:phospholipid/cholesterol/gamma-HCH transport system substrate-binding protein